MQRIIANYRVNQWKDVIVFLAVACHRKSESKPNPNITIAKSLCFCFKSLSMGSCSDTVIWLIISLRGFLWDAFT